MSSLWWWKSREWKRGKLEELRQREAALRPQLEQLENLRMQVDPGGTAATATLFGQTSTSSSAQGLRVEARISRINHTLINVVGLRRELEDELD